MDSTKKKVLTSLACGIIIGSVGTGVIMNYKFRAGGKNFKNGRPPIGKMGELPEGMTEEEFKEMMDQKKSINESTEEQ